MTFSGAAHLAGDVALAGGRAAYLAGRLLRDVGLAALRAEGAGDEEVAEVAAVADALVSAGQAWAMSSPGGHGRDAGADMAAGSAGHAEREWSVVEAAEVLGMTPRHLRRLAAAGAGHQIAGRWVIPAATVHQMLLEREAG